MLEEIYKKCTKIVKQQLGVDITEASRRGPVVSARAAVMSALVQRFTASAVARQFNKTHATVLYFKKKHEDEMRYQDYRIAFDIASAVCEDSDVPLLDSFHKMKDLVFRQKEELEKLKTENVDLTNDVKLKDESLTTLEKYRNLFYALADQLGISKESAA